MKTKKINEVRKQIEYEYKRNSYPDGFPKIPDISGKRYTDQEFFDLEFKNIFLRRIRFVNPKKKTGAI